MLPCNSLWSKFYTIISKYCITQITAIKWSCTISALFVPLVGNGDRVVGDSDGVVGDSDGVVGGGAVANSVTFVELHKMSSHCPTENTSRFISVPFRTI